MGVNFKLISKKGVINPFESLLQTFFYQNGFFLKQITGTGLFWPKSRVKLTIWEPSSPVSKKDETSILNSCFTLDRFKGSSNFKLLFYHIKIKWQFKIIGLSHKRLAISNCWFIDTATRSRWFICMQLDSIIKKL